MDNIAIMYKPYIVGVVIGGVCYTIDLQWCVYTEAILMAACVSKHMRNVGQFVVLYAFPCNGSFLDSLRDVGQFVVL